MNFIHFDDRNLRKLQQNAKSIGGESFVQFSDLFSTNFLKKHSRFSSFDEFEKALSGAGIEIHSQEDFESLSEEKINSVIVANTQFKTFQEMIDTAAMSYLENKLFSGIDGS